MTIPDEIMKTARAVRDKLCIECECKFDRGCGCLEAISNAIMAAQEAERERCAKVAERPSIIPIECCRDTRHAIAAAIRKGEVE